MSLKEDMPCVRSILLPSTVPPSASTGCSRCSTRSRASTTPARPIRPTTSSGPARTPTASRVAVAGFAENDVSIEAKQNTLTIKGEKQAKADEKKGEVLYQGIAARAFERVFQLAEHVQVKGAALENGLLHVDLVREVPEAMKPRRIAIGNSGPKVIDAKAA